ncbi:MAG: T9SS type A sorting domain-containing protein [Bacteroidetes bacterium]|nr:MAG: T9SS type A sorting domain-containing protein [Bacteroidota bacterium]
MKKWLPLLGLLLLGTASHAQFVTLFQENFDGGTVTTTAETEDNLGGPSVAGGWSSNTSLAVSNPNSFHATRTPNKSKYLYTSVFSTATLAYVTLEFDHIAKINLVQQGRLEYSVDNGTTWTQVPASTTYLGSSTGYPSTNYFNGTSYANPSNTPYWDPLANTTPNASWWAHETFDLTPIIVNATTPYTQVQLRWGLVDVNPNPSVATYAGWFIDNIEIIGATCELQPPVLDWSFATARQPVGARYQTSQEIRLEVSDAGSGVDTVWLYYNINGGPDSVIVMTPTVAGSCPTTAQYFHQIDSLNIGDTVRWRVEATDCACPNTTIYPGPASPDPYATFWLDTPPPRKCGQTSVNSFPYLISNLPWTENFENPALWSAGSGSGDAGSSHRGTFPMGNPPAGRNWQVSPLPTNAGYGWSVRSGATGTANTGPAGDATTGNGKYLYTEASQGSSPVNTSPLITPCIDLPQNTCAVLEFRYHMYGSDLDVQLPGVLRVDIDTSTSTANSGFNAYVNGIEILVGQQNTSSSDPWQTAIIPLEDYAGQTVNFRFFGVKRTSGAKQDIAIDDVKIYEPDPVDMEMISFVNPINGLCSYSNAEDIEIVMRSKGCLSQDSIPVGFSVSLNGGTPVIHTDLVTDTLDLGSSLQHIYNPKADLSGYGLFEIYAWVDMPGDGDRDNDTIGPLYIEHIQPISTFPYVMTFDDPSWVYGDGTLNNPGTFGTTDWEQFPPHNQAQIGFVVNREVTEDHNTGPRRDFSNFGQYLYADSRAVGQNFGRIELTRCLDLTSMTHPTFSFWYHMYGSNIDFLKIQVQLDGSTAWSDINGGTISNNVPPHTHETDAWKYKNVDLTPYVGGLIRLRVLVRSKGTSNATDVAIDNVMIWDEDGQTDVGAAYITSPVVVNKTVATLPQAKVYIQNFGESAVSNIPVNITITDACDPTQTQTLTYTHPGPLAAHSGTEVTFPTTPNYPLGTFEMRAWTGMTGDANSYNDTTVSYSATFQSLSIPYAENYDSCGFDTKGWFSQGGLLAWEHGTPNKGGGWTTAFSSPNSWNVANNFDYQNQDEYLRVPPLIDFDTVVGAILRFRHKFNFAANDGGRLEYFQNGQWNQFGFNSSQVGINWYGNAGVGAFNGQEAWTGNQPWAISEFPLLIWNFNTNPLRLRYAMQTTNTSSGGQGWSIDDFQVIVPPQNSVSPIFGDTKEYLVVPNNPATILAKVQNTGEKTLDSCSIQFRVDNGPWSPIEYVAPDNGTWYKGRVIPFEFDTKTVPLAPGQHTIDIQTSLPISTYDGMPKNDNRPADDMFSFTVDVLQDVTPTRDTSAYCNDFEDASLTPLVALHSYNKNRDHDWEFGTPNHPLLNGTHSGVNAWATRLDSNYHNLTESSLHTPFFALVPDSTYKMEFWHKMSGEEYHDGGGVEFSFNGGITWYALGQVFPSGDWYNTTHVTSLSRLNGGWTGNFGWTHSSCSFQVDTPGTVVFRWRFAADYTVDGAGWIIDDFCFNITGEAPTTGPISINELEENAISSIQLYPNPAVDYTDIQLIAAENGDAKFTVTNLVGQTLQTINERITVGKNNIRINTSELTNGVYIVSTELNGEVSTIKFVVAR